MYTKMNSDIFILLISFAFTVIFVRITYLIIQQNGERRKELRKHPVKTMIILGSGGHTTEMLRIIENLNFHNYTPRIYVYAYNDHLSANKVKGLEQNNRDYKFTFISRSREVSQSYFTSIFTTLGAICHSFPIIWRENPGLILCNGPDIMIERAPITTESICWESLVLELKKIPAEIKVHVFTIIETLRNNDGVNQDNFTTAWIDNSQLRLEACLDRIWESLNSGNWKDVPVEMRHSYTLCTILKSIILEIQYESRDRNSSSPEPKILLNIMKQLDKGILLGAPLPTCPELLPAIASRLNAHLIKNIPNEDPSAKIKIKDVTSCEIPEFPQFRAVAVYESPSMETFYRDIFKPKRPAIIRGHWKALILWKDPEYLKRVAGTRTVPIEIGSRYTEEDWTQRLVMFSEFLETHIASECAEIGYLAQHQLFQQIPELRSDFSVPEFCSFTDKQNIEGEEEENNEPDINAWFGPGGTISPLHYDPKNNLLSQVFGQKRIVLYNPEDAEYLYPYETKMLCNTARVDPFELDYEKWPEFRKAKGFICHLKPGEMLYIPPRWWHHVTSLSPSFSVSFWWN